MGDIMRGMLTEAVAEKARELLGKDIGTTELRADALHPVRHGQRAATQSRQYQRA